MATQKDTVRENTADFFTLEWLLNPGGDEQARARENQEAATQLWLSEFNNLPGAEYYYRPENATRDPLSGLTDAALRNNGEYQQGRAAQMQALQQMQGIAGAGGYTPLERDQIAQAQRQAAGYEKSQRDAQVQQMQMRGMAGGGGEMAARLQAQQGGANRAAGQATDIATAAQMRALQAMQAGGQMGQQSQTAATNRQSALDEFNQANTNRRTAYATRDAAARTAARVQNTQDRMGALAGATGQYNTNASSAAANAAARAQQTQGLVTSVLGAVA